MPEQGDRTHRLLTVRFGQNPADVAVSEIFSRVGSDPLAIAGALVFLPNNRAIKALTEAFVRRAEGGLLLPKMVALGDLALDEAIAPFLDGLDAGGPSAQNVISPLDRLMLLAELVRDSRKATGAALQPAECLRLARYLAAAIDELTIEGRSLADLKETDPGGELAEHWMAAYSELIDLLPLYQAQLQKRGECDAATRRNVLLGALAERLRAGHPYGLVAAVGVSTSAPAIANLLACVSRLSDGLVLFPAIDLEMEEEDWQKLGPHPKVEEQLKPQRSLEMHPQFHLKLLLERMAVNRAEIAFGENDKPQSQQKAIADIFCLPGKTAKWRDLPPAQKKLPEMRLAEADDSAQEATIVAIAAREMLEQPGRRVAIITPDRELGLRITAQLARWDIKVDDSAGVPVLRTPHGGMLWAVLSCFSSQFAAQDLLALWKHPLVSRGEERPEWLQNVRALDLLLRGPATDVGLGAIAVKIAEAKDRAKNPDNVLKLGELANWFEVESVPLAEFATLSGKTMSQFITGVVDLLTSLSDGAYWLGATGRQLATFFEDLQGSAPAVLGLANPAVILPLFTELLAEVSVRPTYGSHPRIALYGLLEARLQSADLLICAGLNEDSWPRNPAPDPWLAPHIRRELGLASLDRNIGLAAHDLASFLGAPQVLLTRARRNSSGPAIASRFLLRLKAFLGENLQMASDLVDWAKALDAAELDIRVDRPAPSPSREQRLSAKLSVTDFDNILADPYSFYARKILRVLPEKAVATEPDAAWKGSIIHDVLDAWAQEDHYAQDALLPRAHNMLAKTNLHPTYRALWLPRINAALEWIALAVAEGREHGREPVASEVSGATELAGVKIKGRVDRLDRLADGTLAIVDYKTGAGASHAEVLGGFKLQLGLLGLLADKGAFKDVHGKSGQFEYWSLRKEKGEFGNVVSASKSGRNKSTILAEDFVAHCVKFATQAIDAYITGDEAFLAKAHPDFAKYADYDQLMRAAEWDGRMPLDTEDAL